MGRDGGNRRTGQLAIPPVAGSWRDGRICGLKVVAIVRGFFMRPTRRELEPRMAERGGGIFLRGPSPLGPFDMVHSSFFHGLERESNGGWAGVELGSCG